MDMVVRLYIFFIFVQLVVSASIYHYDSAYGAPASVFENINIPAQVNQLKQRKEVEHETMENTSGPIHHLELNNYARAGTGNEKPMSLKASNESAFSAKITPTPAALGPNIQKLFSHPEVKNLLENPESDHRYLVIYPNGTMKRVKNIETLKQKYKNYVQINTNRNAPALDKKRGEINGSQVPPIDTISIHVQGDSIKEMHYEIPFASINEPSKDKQQFDQMKKESIISIQSIPDEKPILQEEIQTRHPAYESISHQNNIFEIKNETINKQHLKNEKKVNSLPQLEHEIFSSNVENVAKPETIDSENNLNAYQSDRKNEQQTESKIYTSDVIKNHNQSEYFETKNNEQGDNKTLLHSKTQKVQNHEYVTSNDDTNSSTEDHHFVFQQPMTTSIINESNDTEDNSKDEISKSFSEKYEVYSVYLVDHVDDGRNDKQNRNYAEDNVTVENIGSLYKFANSSFIALDELYGEEHGEGLDRTPALAFFFFVPSSEDDEP